MDPRHSAQDVTRCDICEVAVVQMYCVFCHTNLCKPCIWEHISEEYDKHKVVPFEQRNLTPIYPKCAVHETRICEFQCNGCNIFVCSLCTISEHRGHKFSILSEMYNSKKEAIRKDKAELENSIFPKYEEIVLDIETRIERIDEEYTMVTTAVINHGEEWHREIDKIVNKMKLEINNSKNEHLIILKRYLNEMKKTHSLVEETLHSQLVLEESNVVTKILEYNSKMDEFNKPLPKVHISPPRFIPSGKDREHFLKLFGSLKSSSTIKIESDNTLESPLKAALAPIDKPELITSINTEDYPCSVTCHSDEEIWTRGVDNDIKCYNMRGSLMKSIKKSLEELTYDIAVTSDGDLVYSDCNTRSVNKVKGSLTKEVIRLKGWIPRNLCVTCSDDLLVTMFSDDKNQSKVVRYSGSVKKQTFQFNELNWKPLYSGNSDMKYISENKNLDICVGDWTAGAVVVVNKDGKFRFKYTGHFSDTKTELFNPFGIATDRKSQILIADYNNSCIHILDQNGQFLRYIDNCDLKKPYGLCVNKSGYLFVAEYLDKKVKKIRYLQ